MVFTPFGGNADEKDDPLIVRDLRIAAYLVIVCWGIMAVSHILAVVLLSLLFAYILLPLPLGRESPPRA